MSTNTSGEIYRLIPKVMADVGAIGKGRTNQQQGYAFRGIDDVYNALQGPLAAHGVFIVPEVIEQVREERQTRHGGALLYTILRVRHTFFAPDGSCVQAVTVGEAMDSGDKSANKAMSAAMKYACLEVFAVPTVGDNDTENHTHEVAPRQQQAKPANGAAPKKASAAQVKRLKELLATSDIPPETQSSWLEKAHARAFADMTADTIDKCIEFAAKHQVQPA